jgi:DNA mismatch repair protein MutL
MGFRGEALASIAAVAHVELRTRRSEDEVGTCIQTEGSRIIDQQPCSCAVGASFHVKNLYFNVPARRNFLKSDAVEFRHIIDEFERIAFAHPDRAFSLHHNGNEMYRLAGSNFRQRITALYGAPYNQRLVPVDEKTDIISINGFIVKPEFAKKTRGEQFFFLNRRFIKSGYLHHAIQSAFEQLLPAETHAGYFLFLDVDPKTIDVNIHPTKTEVKFEDEKAIYAILRSAVKRALGQYSIVPSLDFEQEQSIELPYKVTAPVSAPGIHINPDYNPFASEKATGIGNGFSIRDKSNLENWQELYALHLHQSPAEMETIQASQPETTQQQITSVEQDGSESSHPAWQLHDRYILSPIKSGLVVIDQQRAHERVLYERYINMFETNPGNCQQLLFPETIELPPREAELLDELLESVHQLGFDVRAVGPRIYSISGIPAGTEEQQASQLLLAILATYQSNEQDLQVTAHDNLARSLAKQSAIRQGRRLNSMEMQALVDELFACAHPSFAPDGKPVLITYPIEELDKRFRR